MQDHYQTLGVGRNAAKAEVRKAYLALAKKHHPDRKGTGNHERFQKIAEAYKILFDTDKRKKYDLTLPARPAGGPVESSAQKETIVVTPSRYYREKAEREGGLRQSQREAFRWQWMMTALLKALVGMAVFAVLGGYLASRLKTSVVAGAIAGAVFGLALLIDRYVNMASFLTTEKSRLFFKDIRLLLLAAGSGYFALVLLTRWLT